MLGNIVQYLTLTVMFIAWSPFEVIPAVERNTILRRLTTEIRYEKCVVRRFRSCANAIQCAYTNLDSTAYCTPSLYGIVYCC